jgi:hypothetical protein
MRHISPQFHVIFDNKFETVTSLAIGEPLDKQWVDIFWLGSECFLDVDYDFNDQPILPSLLDITKAYLKAKAKQQNFELGHLIDFDGFTVKDALVPPPHHELLQDGQAATPLQSQATSQAALASYPYCSRGRFQRSHCPCDACSRGSGQRLYSRWDCDWVACSGPTHCWSTSTKYWDMQGWPCNNSLFAH